MTLTAYIIAGALLERYSDNAFPLVDEDPDGAAIQKFVEIAEEEWEFTVYVDKQMGRFILYGIDNEENNMIDPQSAHKFGESWLLDFAREAGLGDRVEKVIVTPPGFIMVVRAQDAPDSPSTPPVSGV